MENQDKFHTIKSDPNIKQVLIDDQIYISKQYIVNTDNIKLHHIVAKSNTNAPIGELLIIPGTYEYSINYIPLIVGIAKSNYESHVLDLRGCGLSGGCRHSLDMIGMQRDILLLLSKCRCENLYIMAHSASCTVLLSVLLNNPQIKPSGIILWSPYLEVDEYDTSLLLIIYKLIKANINKKKTGIYAIDFDPTLLTKNEEMIQKMIHGLRQVRLIQNIRQWNSSIFSFCSQIKAPLIIMQGENDQISPISNSEKLFDLYGSESKKLITLKGLSHSFLYDMSTDELVSSLIGWMSVQKKCPKFDVGSAIIRSPRVKVSFWYRFTVVMLILSYLGVGTLFHASYAKGRFLSSIIGWPYLLLRHIFFHK